jgi:hypothetical protein
MPTTGDAALLPLSGRQISPAENGAHKGDDLGIFFLGVHGKFDAALISCRLVVQARPLSKLGCSAQLFAYNAPKDLLERLLSSPHVLSQNLIDGSLVVAATCALDLVAEPRKYLIIETYCDPRFALRNGNDRSTFGLTEIVFTLHNVPRIGSSLGRWQDAPKSDGHFLLARCKPQRAGDPTHLYQEWSNAQQLEANLFVREHLVIWEGIAHRKSEFIF